MRTDLERCAAWVWSERGCISDARIPPDRQMVYALELIACVRPGEAAALRWRHYDPTIRPLGRMLVAKSYNTRKNREKLTKTDAVKYVPVHPMLAAMLAEWKLGGWAEMMGRAPTPDDLIVPLTPAATERRRSRDGEPFRGHDHSGKRWHEEDLPALEWQHRRHYDIRATFITLAIKDGADPDVLETRVTHTRKAATRSMATTGDCTGSGRAARSRSFGSRANHEARRLSSRSRPEAAKIRCSSLQSLQALTMARENCGGGGS